MAATKSQRMVKSFDHMLRDAQLPGFINGDQVVEAIAKALTTGGIPTAGTSYGDMSALKLENLDSTMTSVLFEQDHLKLFSAIPRVPSIQPLYQWIRRDRYGSSRGAVGFPEGGAPLGGSGAWTRNTQTVKYLGTRGGYTHQAMVVGQMGGSFVDPVTEENRNRTLELLEKMERHIMWGDKSIKSAAGVEVHFDGLVTQLAGANMYTNTPVTSIIDMEGAPMDFEKLEDIGERFVTRGKLLNFARVQSWWTPHVLSDLAKLKFQAERIALGSSVPAGYRTGVPLDGHQTQRGFIPFEDSIFMETVENDAPLAAGETSALAAPSAVSATPASDATSKMEAGTYYYGVSTLNDAGESAPFATTAAAVAALEKVTLSITNVTNATGYRIYRGLLSTLADAKWIGTVTQGAGPTTFVDLNAWRPGTGRGLIMNVAEPDIALPQMSPMIKWPLAITNTTLEFLLLLYAVLALKAPERVYFVKNVGRRA